METFVQQQTLTRLTELRNRPHHHGPVDAGPVDSGIRRIDLVRKCAHKDIFSRHEFVFEICLVRHDIAAAWIDKHDWTVQSEAPRLAAVTIRGLFELSKVLCGQFDVDSGRLRRRGRRE
jgi:hypothetical protein